jgi:hypothetical protein
MTIRIWQSYSCNNSSSYRLIARFVDAEAADTAAGQLTAAFDAYAQELGRDGHGDSSLLSALARSHDLAWDDEGWGGSEDGPFVFAEGAYVFVHHHYCLGLGPGVPAFLAARGAKVDDETWADVGMSMLFRAPSGNARFDDDLALLFAQPRDTTDYKGPKFRGPWSTVESHGRAAWFRDAGTVGLYIPVAPTQIAVVKAWLSGHGIERASLRFDEPADEQLFAALATARCTACHGALEYLDPRLHDIETPQLVCRPCGGLYELSAFFVTPPA